MNSKKDEQHIEKALPTLCIKCQQMYGNPVFMNMCSLCYKLSQNASGASKSSEKVQKKQNIVLKEEKNPDFSIMAPSTKKIEQSALRREINKEPTERERERTREKQEKKPTNRCFACNKKVGMLGFECSHCSSQFCKSHRLPEDHECSVDYVGAGKRLLTAANPEVKRSKIAGMDK